MEATHPKELLKATLADQPFLKDISARSLELIADCAVEKHFASGDYLLREGEEANEFYLIRGGKIALGTFVSGRGSVNIQYLGEGKLVGWSWLIEPYHWHFSAMAVESTDTIALDGKKLREMCEQDHDLGYELIKRLAFVVGHRLRMTRLQLR